MPRFDPAAIVPNNQTGYPAPFADAVAGRWKRRIGPVAGFAHLGACHVELAPGAWSSQRHWHDGEDEMVVMLSGEAVLVENAGRTVLRGGDIATFAAGVADGHHLVNESDAPCVFVALSAGPHGGGGYSDIDMRFTTDNRYVRNDGTPYPV
jgi:uncharacterized cupin superfamily protein